MILRARQCVSCFSIFFRWPSATVALDRYSHVLTHGTSDGGSEGGGGESRATIESFYHPMSIVLTIVRPTSR